MKVTPLPHEWMVASIIGFFVSWMYVYGVLGFVRWGVAFMLFFLMLFVASIINLSSAGTEDEDIRALSVKKHKHR